MNFNDQTIWITGASSGIGKALALQFNKNGANVILSSRNEEALQKVRESCKYPEKAKVLPLDLANSATFNKKAAEAVGLFGKLDMLVNNGGISQRSYAKDTQLEVDRRLFEVNYFGTIGLTKAVLPYFLKQKSGHFVVVSSVMGKIGTPLRTAYAASKHALHGFFDSLRAELDADGIAVTLLLPGYVRTDVSKNALTGDGSKFEKMDTATANGLDPDDFAKKALRAIAARKHEVIIAGPRESGAVFLKRFFPKILANVVKKVNVT